MHRQYVVFLDAILFVWAQLQLGDCLFWNTGLHMEVLTNCLWMVLTVLRTPVYCKRSSLAAIQDEPVLKHLDLLLSKTGADALAGVSGRIEARPLHDANVCTLTMAFLTVRFLPLDHLQPLSPVCAGVRGPVCHCMCYSDIARLLCRWCWDAFADQFDFLF